MNEDKNLDESLNEDDVIDKIPVQFKEKKNSIIGVYLLEKGKETTIFNPEKNRPFRKKLYNWDFIK